MRLGTLSPGQVSEQLARETLAEIRRLIGIGEPEAARELARDQPPQIRRALASQVTVGDPAQVKLAAIGALFSPERIRSVAAMLARTRAAERTAAGCGQPACRVCKPPAAR
jgi:hypothetical protein